MARPSLLTPAEWETVRHARIAGTPKAAILKEFPQLTQAALDRWEQRQKLPTPSMLIHEARRAASRAANARALPGQTPIVADNQKDLSRLSETSRNIQKPARSALQITLDAAKDTANSCLAGLVHRAAPVLDRWTPPTPSDIYEGAALTKLVRSAGGLDSRGPSGTINVQVNVGPWGKPRVDSFRDVTDA